MQEKLRFQDKVTFIRHIIHLPGNFLVQIHYYFAKKSAKLEKNHARDCLLKNRIPRKLSCFNSSMEGGVRGGNSRFYRGFSGWMNDNLIVSSQMF